MPVLAAAIAAAVLLGAALPGAACAFEPGRLERVRSVEPAVVLRKGVPTLILVARGPSAEPGRSVLELIHEVGDERLRLDERPFQSSWAPGNARQVFSHHLLWDDGVRERVIGSTLLVRDEMPSPDQSPRYTGTVLVCVTYGFDTASQQFYFDVDAHAAAPRPQVFSPEWLREHRALLSPRLFGAEHSRCAALLRRMGTEVLASAADRPDAVVVPDLIDFVQTRDREIEALVERGIPIVYAGELENGSWRVARAPTRPGSR